MPVELWWEFRTLKSGKRSKRAEVVGIYRYSRIDKCERCRRMGSTAWVRQWWYQRYPHYMRQEFPHEPVLCIGCFNKIRPLWRADREAHELAALSRKLEREIAHAKKHEVGGGHARVPSGNDGGRAERKR